MKSKITLPILTAIIWATSLSGCGVKSSSPADQAVVNGNENPTPEAEAIGPIFSCTAPLQSDAIARCLGGDKPEVKAVKLAEAMKRWSSVSGEWNPLLLDVTSVSRRFGLDVNEKQCLKTALCKEIF